MSSTERNEKKQTIETVPTSATKAQRSAPADVISDPARADQVGADWTDEGGATNTGPATNSDEN